RGLTRSIPFGQTIVITTALGGVSLKIDSASAFKVIDRGLGRVALETAGGFVSVDANGGVVVRSGEPRDAETFQWVETPYGDVALLSLMTHRYVRVGSGELTADQPGPTPDRADGIQLVWRSVLIEPGSNIDRRHLPDVR